VTSQSDPKGKGKRIGTPGRPLFSAIAPFFCPILSFEARNAGGFCKISTFIKRPLAVPTTPGTSIARVIHGCETDGWATSRRRDGMEEIDNQVANKAACVYSPNRLTLLHRPEPGRGGDSQFAKLPGVGRRSMLVTV